MNKVVLVGGVIGGRDPQEIQARKKSRKMGYL